MVAKGISQDDFSKNGVGRRSNRSFWMRTMTVLGSSPTHSPRRAVPYFYRHVRYCIFKNNKFCFENDIFRIHSLGKCEGIGEDLRHGNGHLDIQVGSRIYLNVCLNWSIAYALKWRVTHLG